MLFFSKDICGAGLMQGLSGARSSLVGEVFEQADGLPYL